ncbi:hypothetical protein J7E88_16255 [Streptomyces sp. ISL-10]|uniref:hypothetical protein n=1 Tax=Streptomyces sp. ISL-10 TaxID=2819172 RepID=UPI001BE8C358|nr:hypothetical protein [Streptomyces sp. ISL-10]MBT2366821.1 hypothetical protein [Streptomyces sp. ISL-10]
MSMSHVRDMRIDPERVSSAVEFFESYANSCLAELDSLGSEDISSSTTQNAPDSDSSRWMVLSDAASALRVASEWAMLFDPNRALTLLDRCGTLLHELSYPFGNFLKVIAGPWFEDPPISGFGEWIEDVVRLNRLEGSRKDTQNRGGIPATLIHPQQQAYLVMAAVSSPLVSSEFRRPLRQIILESPHRVGVTPVGALGTPIRRFWAVSEALTRDGGEGAAVVAEHLAEMGQKYAESAELAMANEYCWRNAASPIDIVDVDMTGIVVSAARILGIRTFGRSLELQLPKIHPLGRVQLEVALEVTRSGPSGAAP